MNLATSPALLALVLACSAAQASEEGVAAPPASAGAAAIDVETQPLRAHARRLADALELAGAPLNEAESQALAEALAIPAGGRAVAAIEEVFAPRVLLEVAISPEARVSLARGPAPARLWQGGWSTFLVRVRNEAGVTARLDLSSPQAAPLYLLSDGGSAPPPPLGAVELEDRWLDLASFERSPLQPALSGLELEYRVVHLYARDRGRRDATFRADVGHGTADLGFRGDLGILFTIDAATEVVFEVEDEDGTPAMASFLIRDEKGFHHPPRAKRVAPDFWFQEQIYRASGESVLLPPGRYTIEATRGPEYRSIHRELVVTAGPDQIRQSFRLERWVHPRARGWYSGDHHIHGGGCAHYAEPTCGVLPEDMFRHQLGEDLSVGCMLSWGPCWDFQKQFFEGDVSDLSQPNHVMRYDVEVSGFPSSHAGHVCLLRLSEDDYPGAETIDDWPSWCLPILQWAKEQGAVTGFAHSGFGLETESSELPHFEVPSYAGIGANEFVVDVTHGVVDFLSTVDTPYVWELNMWYHVLNCGFRTRISGESDFPCIYHSRLGVGRVYCKLDGPLDYDAWVAALAAGRSYVGDGLSHFLELSAGGLELGTQGSELRLEEPGSVRVEARVAALLPEDPDEAVSALPYWKRPYWHIERARIGTGRKVAVELVVNGYPAASQDILADGSEHALVFDVPLERSSWIALRILPSSHTNPFFVLVDGAPIRASAASAHWLLQGVDRCFEQKQLGVRPEELPAMEAAYEHAREVYRRIRAESPQQEGPEEER